MSFAGPPFLFAESVARNPHADFPLLAKNVSSCTARLTAAVRRCNCCGRIIWGGIRVNQFAKGRIQTPCSTKNFCSAAIFTGREVSTTPIAPVRAHRQPFRRHRRGQVARVALRFNSRHLMLPVARFENRQAGVLLLAGQRIAHKVGPCIKQPASPLLMVSATSRVVSVAEGSFCRRLGLYRDTKYPARFLHVHRQTVCRYDQIRWRSRRQSAKYLRDRTFCGFVLTIPDGTRIPPAPWTIGSNDHRRDFMTMRRHSGGQSPPYRAHPIRHPCGFAGGSKQVFWQIAFPQVVH